MEKVNKFTNILLWVLMGMSVLVTLLNRTGAITEEPFLIWAYILTGGGVLAALVFPLLGLFSNPKALKKFVFGLVGLAIILFVSYQLASDELLQGVGSDITANNPATLKLVGTGIFVMWFALLGGVGSVVFSGVMKNFK